MDGTSDSPLKMDPPCAMMNVLGLPQHSARSGYQDYLSWAESGGANNTNHADVVHNKEEEVPLTKTKSQAPPESRATYTLEKKKGEEEEKRQSDEIKMLLGDLQADGARGTHKQLLEELVEQFGSKWATVSKK